MEGRLLEGCQRFRGPNEVQIYWANFRRSSIGSWWVTWQPNLLISAKAKVAFNGRNTWDG